MFWQVADRWPVRRFYLARLPTPGDAAGITKPLRLGLDEADRLRARSLQLDLTPLTLQQLVVQAAAQPADTLERTSA